jgi:hypothetical protein
MHHHLSLSQPCNIIIIYPPTPPQYYFNNIVAPVPLRRPSHNITGISYPSAYNMNWIQNWFMFLLLCTTPNDTLPLYVALPLYIEQKIWLMCIICTPRNTVRTLDGFAVVWKDILGFHLHHPLCNKRPAKQPPRPFYPPECPSLSYTLDTCRMYQGYGQCGS